MGARAVAPGDLALFCGPRGPVGSFGARPGGLALCCAVGRCRWVRSASLPRDADPLFWALGLFCRRSAWWVRLVRAAGVLFCGCGADRFVRHLLARDADQCPADWLCFATPRGANGFVRHSLARDADPMLRRIGFVLSTTRAWVGSFGSGGLALFCQNHGRSGTAPRRTHSSAKRNIPADQA
jgi:hypothetical protein